MSEPTAPQAPPSPWPPGPSSRRPGARHPLRIAGAVAGGLVLLGAGIGIGAASKSATVRTVTRTITRTVTVKVPGPVITRTIRVPGPVVTKTAGPPPPSATMPGDGTFAVGTAPGDWPPGTWQTTAADSGNCYWATLSDLSGNTNSIIANGNTSGPTTLQVGSGIAGVQVNGCNTWNKIG